MADFVVDSFTDTNDVQLGSHTGETGATWTKAVGDASNYLWVQGNALAGEGGTEAIYYASGIPTNADYDVVADISYLTETGNVLIGILGRLSTDGENYYRLDYNGFDNTFVLSKNVSGTDSNLGVVGWTTANQTIKLEMRGTAIKAYIDDVIPTATTGSFDVTDSDVSDKGRVGVYKYGGVGTASDFFRINSITGSDAAAAETITMDKWFQNTHPPLRRKIRAVPY